MSLLICLPESMDPDALRESLLSLDSNLNIEIVAGEVNKPKEVEFAVVWNHKDGLLLNYPNLKAILSYGHGVDNILADKNLPIGVILGSLDTLKTGPVISFIASSSCLRCSALVFIERNLYIVNGRPLIPLLFCLNRIGPCDVDFMAKAQISNTGLKTKIIVKAPM